jgi:SOS-response transcriptional repressor LexA
MPYTIDPFTEEHQGDGRRRPRPDVAARNRATPPDSRERIMAFIDRWIAEHVNAPTIREVALGCGNGSTSAIQYHISALLREGRLICTHSGARGFTTPRALMAVRTAYKQASTSAGSDVPADEVTG